MKGDYVMIVVLAVAAVFLWNGKGSWLIAGYNTMGKESKAKYDHKKLCRVVSGCIAAVDLLLIVSSIMGETTADKYENVFTVIIFIIVVITVILSNTICRKKQLKDD